MSNGKLEQGRTYDCLVNGQVWSFIVVGVDEENKGDIWITWMNDETEQEECHDIDSLLKRIEDHQTNSFAGIIYPRGDSEEAQAKALSELLEKPRYKFAQMEVPRAMVLSDHFSSEGYRSDRDYMDFVFDPDSSILTVTSPDSEAHVPSWVMEHFKVSAITQVHGEKTIFLLKIEQEITSNE
jgi:hypothetical protein